MTTGPFFIDFEAFQHGNETIIKEMCIIEFARPLLPLYYIFGAPYDYKYIAEDAKVSFNWEKNHHHKLRWEEGYTVFCASCIMRHIKDNFPAWDLGIFY